MNLLQYRLLNGWPLFFLIAAVTFAAMVTGYLLIGVLLALHNGYYRSKFHNNTDLLLRMASYVFIFALTITSFFPVRRKMRPEHWRWLHLIGIWYFWVAIWASYAPMAMSSDAKTIDVVYTVIGLVVLVLRIAAYLRARTHNLPEANQLL